MTEIKKEYEQPVFGVEKGQIFPSVSRRFDDIGEGDSVIGAEECFFSTGVPDRWVIDQDVPENGIPTSLRSWKIRSTCKTP